MLKKLVQKILTNKIFKYLLLALGVFITILLIYVLSFTNKIYPNVYILDIPVGGLTQSEAINKISGIAPPPVVFLKEDSQTFELSTNTFELTYDFVATSQRALLIGRSGNFFHDMGRIISQLFSKNKLGLDLSLNSDKLTESLLVITSELNVQEIVPSATLVSGQIEINKGQTGLSPNILKLRSDIGYNLSFNLIDPVEISIETTGHSLTEPEAAILMSRAQKLIGKGLGVEFENRTYQLIDSELVSLLDVKGGYNSEKINQFIQTIKTIERLPQDAVFSFEDGRVQQFKPSLDGISINTETLKNMLIGNIRALEEGEEKVLAFNLPVTTVSPKIKNEDVNNLGIKELIGIGTSKFAHSIPNRIHNVGLASSKFHGVIIAPGETFSFNDVLGDVSAYTGYKQAFVIKEGRTVLGDGGGVCQVSTTFFRAAMNAGLPILERKAHSYRVGYYEQDSPPGFDATVFAPTADLKVENNTGHHILIQTIYDAANTFLAFELYGTKDGREAIIGKPVTTGVSAPGPDVYIDDPTLPLGTIKQVEYRAWGSKVTFGYKVIRGEETLFEKSFVSSYKPWAAVYLKGTAPN
jgi:vancomycin resistance protein YoaR